MVRVRRRQRPLLCAECRVGRPEPRHRHRYTTDYRGALDNRRAPSTCGSRPTSSRTRRASSSRSSTTRCTRTSRTRAATPRCRATPASRACSPRTASTSRSAATRTSTSATRAATGAGRQSLVSYVTGGGGADVQSLGTAAARTTSTPIGWSYTTVPRDRSAGPRRCRHHARRSPLPQGHDQRLDRHRDADRLELGRTFDVQTYTFTPKPDTFIDSAPPAGTTSTSATFTFHAQLAERDLHVQARRRDRSGVHEPEVVHRPREGLAHVHGVRDGRRRQRPAPGDLRPGPSTPSPPTAPTGFTATATSPFSVEAQLDRGDRQHRRHRLRRAPRRRIAHHDQPATTYTDTAVVGIHELHVHAAGPRRRRQHVGLRPRRPGHDAGAGAARCSPTGSSRGPRRRWTLDGGLVVEGDRRAHGGRRRPRATRPPGTRSRRRRCRRPTRTRSPVSGST